MWYVPLLFIIIGLLCVWSSYGHDEDIVWFFVGVVFLIISLIAIGGRIASPMCYDGSLVGEALRKACS
jgi:cytochrome bd-type quinol oxidase subunit 2